MRNLKSEAPKTSKCKKILRAINSNLPKAMKNMEAITALNKTTKSPRKKSLINQKMMTKRVKRMTSKRTWKSAQWRTTIKSPPIPSAERSWRKVDKAWVRVLLANQE